MLRGVFTALVLLGVLVLSSVPADAHSGLNSLAMASHDNTQVAAAPLSYDHDRSPCHTPDCMHDLMCCPACGCSAFIGWILAAEPTQPPAVPATLVYFTPSLSWTDGSGLLPALPPPRSVV